MSTAGPSIKNVPPLLLCEALGFSPQLLLDDIINIANNAVQDGVNGMEEFLQKWADERVAQGDENDPKTRANIEETTHEVEQGLVAFQTLLEYHTDIAFDFFEAWSLRNIFMIPPDLPVVLPHQEGLDLTVTPEQEQEAMDEVEELRKRLDGVCDLFTHFYASERVFETSNANLTVFSYAPTARAHANYRTQKRASPNSHLLPTPPVRCWPPWKDCLQSSLRCIEQCLRCRHQKHYLPPWI